MTVEGKLRGEKEEVEDGRRRSVKTLRTIYGSTKRTRLIGMIQYKRTISGTRSSTENGDVPIGRVI